MSTCTPDGARERKQPPGALQDQRGRNQTQCAKQSSSSRKECVATLRRDTQRNLIKSDVNCAFRRHLHNSACCWSLNGFRRCLLARGQELHNDVTRLRKLMAPRLLHCVAVELVGGQSHRKCNRRQCLSIVKTCDPMESLAKCWLACRRFRI